MKKFSNFDKKEDINKYPSQIKKTIDRLIDENIAVQFNNEPDSSILEGKEELINIIDNYINTHTSNSQQFILESFKHSSIHVYNVPVINTTINNLYDELDKLNIIPEPKELFSSDDYKLVENVIELTTLKNVPSEKFSDYLSKKDIEDYFIYENSININRNDKGWNVKFNPNSSYIKNNRIDFKRFITENNNFIADFVKCCEMVVGKGKININDLEKMV